MDRHEMLPIGSNESETLFECSVSGCGRRVVLHRRDVRLTVVMPGDEAALHSGSTGPIAVAAAVVPRQTMD
jgi:hypothetical protein